MINYLSQKEMDNYSVQISEAFTKAFNSIDKKVDEDVEKIDIEFRKVLENPLNYCTLEIKRVSEYHGYNFQYSVVYGKNTLRGHWVNDIKTQGLFTYFPVYSDSSNDIKEKVAEKLKDVFTIKYAEKCYIVFIRHSK